MRSPSDGEAAFQTLWRQLGNGPDPTPEHHFDPDRNWRFDFAWTAERVAVEIDGGNHKAAIITTKSGEQRAVPIGRHTKDNDLDRCNTATARGWLVLHFTPSMLTHDPAHCIGLVLAALHNAASVEYTQTPRKEFAR